MKESGQHPNLKDLKNNSNSLSKFYSSVNRYILTNFSAFSASKLFLMLDHTKPYVEKMLYIEY